jgi:hypothetical protein
LLRRLRRWFAWNRVCQPRGTGDTGNDLRDGKPELPGSRVRMRRGCDEPIDRIRGENEQAAGESATDERLPSCHRCLLSARLGASAELTANPNGRALEPVASQLPAWRRGATSPILRDRDWLTPAFSCRGLSYPSSSTQLAQYLTLAHDLMHYRPSLLQRVVRWLHGWC